MLPEGTDYEQLYSEYRWEIPEFCNIGVDVCDKWAAVEPNRLGLIHVNQEGVSRNCTFADLQTASPRQPPIGSRH